MKKTSAKKTTDEGVKVNKDTVTETLKATGNTAWESVKKLVEEGNARKVSVTDKKGKELASFPLSFGVIGSILAPVPALFGGLAALLTGGTISIEKKGAKEAPKKQISKRPAEK